MSGAACPCCGCAAPGATRAHAIAAALRDDDLDAAMTLGLLAAGSTCTACAPACRDRVEAARSARQQALAARERHRARAERLARRERERAERRKPATPVATAPSQAAPSHAAPSLPAAAAAALARAKARAAGAPRE